MSVREWSDITAIVKAHVDHCSCLEEPTDALKTFKRWLKDISDKFTSMSVSYYVKKLIKYYNKHKTHFITMYTRERKAQSSKAEEHESKIVGLKYV